MFERRTADLARFFVSAREQYRWLDFSGAPPILIAKNVAAKWRGTTNPKTGHYSQPSFEEAVTDYDRCIQIALNGNGVLRVGKSHVLVLYTEYDLHTWVAEHQIISCSGSVPAPGKVKKIKWGMPKKVWGTPVFWHAAEKEYYLMNSAADGRRLSEEDVLPVTLPPGRYRIESCYLSGEHSGVYHRLVHEGGRKRRPILVRARKVNGMWVGAKIKISNREIVDAIRRDRESYPKGT